MHTRHTLSCSLALITALISMHCGPATTPTQQDDPSGPPELSNLTGQELAAQTLGPDPYEIGTSWYDYTQTTHVLTPRDHVYILERAGAPTAAFEITSYYDERGESGRFTLRYRGYNEGNWGAISELTTTQNVKEGNLCVSEIMQEVECASVNAFLIFRIVRRALPDAGFAVKDPGVFLRSQFEDNPDTDRLYFFEVASLEALDMDTLDLKARGPRPSSAADPIHSRVGWIHERAGEPARQDVHFQVTTSLHASLWQITQVTRDEQAGTTSLTIEALCQRVDFARQRNFDPDARQSFTITLPTDSTYSGAQVALCDANQDTGISGEMLHTTQAPFSGMWQTDPAFDLFIEQVAGRIAVRLAPGNLLWNWSQSEAGRLNPASLENPLDPGAVWDTFYAR